MGIQQTITHSFFGVGPPETLRTKKDLSTSRENDLELLQDSSDPEPTDSTTNVLKLSSPLVAHASDGRVLCSYRRRQIHRRPYLILNTHQDFFGYIALNCEVLNTIEHGIVVFIDGFLVAKGMG